MIEAMGKQQVLVLVVVGILLALAAFLLIGSVLDDETEIERQPVNGSDVLGGAATAQTSAGTVG